MRYEFYRIIMRYIAMFLAFASALLLIVYLSTCVNISVSQTEYGIVYQPYIAKFKNIYTQGKVVLQMGEQMFKVTRTLQNYQTNINCLSQDKVLLNLDVSMQYQYEREQLIPIIFKQFDNVENYNTFIQNRIKSSILNACLLFTAEEYYSMRGTIDLNMYDKLKNEINNDNIGTTISYFQLVNIEFPSEFSTIITEKQNIQQLATTTLNNRASILTQSETLLKSAQYNAQITITQANNTAEIIINRATTLSNAQQQLWINRAYGYLNVKNSLNLTETDLVEYIISDNIRQTVNLITSTN